MCLKNVNLQLIEPKSIRTRLTLFYSAAVFILLSLAAIFLYWVTITLLYKADYEFLQDEVETIQYIMQSDPIDQKSLKEAVLTAPREEDGSIYRYFIRIYDENHKIILQTPGAEDVMPDDNNFLKAPKLPGKKRYSWYEYSDTSYLLLQSHIEIGDSNKTGVVQIVLDISYQHSMVHDRSKIIAVLLIGTLLSLLIGFFIANRGLRSLYLLSQTMQRITATSLNQRIDPKSWPVELAGIGVAFNQMLDRMEASFTRLKQFSADLSHELRTPVTNLIGATEVSLSYGQTVEEYRQVMESNLEELQRISSLIENILFLAKAENPQLEVKKSLLNVTKEIELVCEFYQAMADEKNISLTVNGQAELSANPDMFRRLISNIISNALKYTKEGGWIKCDIQDSLDLVTIVVRDNGEGVAKENLPRIFDRFYRTDAARSQKVEGVGLGLPIAKSIVEVHRGKIVMDSDLGLGTTITIILPKV